jgi:hypothetical protein
MIESEEALARAAADTLSLRFGDAVLITVEKAIKGEFGNLQGDSDRSVFIDALNTAASVVQIGWFIFEVSRYCWRKYRLIKDPAALREAAYNEVVALPSMSGNDRKTVISAVVDKLDNDQSPANPAH